MKVYQQRWAEMLQSETAIREIDSLLQRIEKSLFDLQLPASQTRELFAPNVRYVDALALDGSAPESAVLNASTWSWQIGNDESDRRSDLKIWSKFLQQVSYSSTADFTISLLIPRTGYFAVFGKIDPTSKLVRTSTPVCFC